MKKIIIAGEANPPVNKTARSVTKYLIQVSADGATYEDFDAVRGTNFTVLLKWGNGYDHLPSLNYVLLLVIH